MHIADGILSGPVLVASGAVAAGGVAAGLASLDVERIPRVGVLASVFFVASLIRVPLGPSSAHLLLLGLVGLLLGWAAFPALAAALLLQAVLFGYGGLLSLGANVCIMAIPAVAVFLLLARPIDRTSSPGAVFALAFTAGALGIVLAVLIAGVELLATGREFAAPVGALLLGHLPVMAIEGFVTGFAVSFLMRVRPDLVRGPRRTA